MADKTYQTTLLIRGDSKDAVKSVQLTRDELEKLTGAQQRNTSITDKLSKSYKAMGIGLAAAGAVATAALYKVVQNTEAQDAAVAQLNATLKSTGGASGKFAEDLISTAGALQQVTTYGDEAIIELQSLLLTFKDIKGDNFDRTTEAALDMATAMKVDLKSAALQLGKALNDPAGQLSALTRSGITFNDAQKDMIKSMVEAGDKASAQKIILQELESQFGGSAEAAASTMGGALQQLSNNWNDLFEAEETASAGIVESIHTMNATISSPEFKEGMQTLVAALLDITNNALKAMAAMADFATGVGESIAKIVGGTATDDVAGLEAEVDRLTKAMADLEMVGQTTGYTYESLSEELEAAKEKLRVNEVLFGKQAVVVGKTTEAIEDNTVAVEDNVDASDSLGQSTKDLSKELTALTKSAKKTQDQIAKNASTFQKAHSELDSIVRKTEDYIEALKFETEQTTRSAREQAIENDVRAAGTRITEDQAARIREASAAKYDAQLASEELAEAEQSAARESEQAWSSARTTLSNFFFEMAADGKNAFDTLVDGFKAMITKMLAEAAANQILLQFGSAATSAGFSSLGSSLSSAGGAGSAGGAAGLSGAAAGGFAALAVGVLRTADDLENNLYGPGDVLSGKSLNTKYGDSLGGLGKFLFPDTSKLDFLGVGDAVNKLLGQKNDGKNRGFSTFDLSTGAIDAQGIGKSFNQGNVDTAAALPATLQQFADAIGGSTLSGKIFVGGDDGIAYGGKTYGQNAEAFFKDAFADVIASADNLSDELKPLLLDFDGTASEMADFAQVIYELDQATGGVDKQMVALLQRFKGTTPELADFSSAIASLQSATGVNAATQALRDFNKTQLTSAEAYERHADALRREIGLFDGTAESAQRMSAMLNDSKIAAYNFTLALQDMGRTLGDAAASQAQNIRDAARSEEELLIRRVVGRDMLIDALEDVTDPEKAATLQSAILDLNQAAFNSLTEDQQIAQADSYAAIAESTNATFQQAIKEYSAGMSITQDELNARVISALEKAAGDQKSAAQTMKEASNLMIEAARLFTGQSNPFSREAVIG